MKGCLRLILTGPPFVFLLLSLYSLKFSSVGIAAFYRHTHTHTQGLSVISKMFIFNLFTANTRSSVHVSTSDVSHRVQSLYQFSGVKNQFHDYVQSKKNIISPQKSLITFLQRSLN